MTETEFRKLLNKLDGYFIPRQIGSTAKEWITAGSLLGETSIADIKQILSKEPIHCHFSELGDDIRIHVSNHDSVILRIPNISKTHQILFILTVITTLMAGAVMQGGQPFTNPGEIMKDFKKLPRLVGSIDEKISSIVSQIYTHVFGVEIISMPNCKTANAVKLTTNVFRDINIAFVNELALLFEKLGIDTYTVIEAAKRKYNFQPHFPGPGVGGPCLPVNSYQYLNSSKKIDDDFLKIVKYARRINENMPHHVVNLLSNALSESNTPLNNSTIALLGISYKPNIRDVQMAPSKEIIKILKEKNAKIKIFDPYFTSQVFGLTTEKSIFDTLSESDAAILITGHKEFQNLDLKKFSRTMKNPVLIDCTGLVKPLDAKENGFIFRGIGRGDI